MTYFIKPLTQKVFWQGVLSGITFGLIKSPLANSTLTKLNAQTTTKVRRAGGIYSYLLRSISYLSDASRQVAKEHESKKTEK